jgi:hypothetical protein
VSLVVVAGAELEAALQAFGAAGYETLRAQSLSGEPARGHLMIALEGDVQGALRDADRRRVRYLLVHVGPDDGGGPEGSFARAHHRVRAAGLVELATLLKPRDRLLVTCLAFAYKNGLPPESDWVVDTRFLSNPYWVEELRDLDGTSEPVRRYVLDQPAAQALLSGLEAWLRPALPLYARSGRSTLTVGFGCTGGRHRSVAMAAEMARRLGGGDFEIEVRLRDL